MLKKELVIDEKIIVRVGGWAETQMIPRVYVLRVTPTLEEKVALALQDFSAKIHERLTKNGRDNDALSSL